MKQPLCVFIEIHWGELKTFCSTSALTVPLSFYRIAALTPSKRENGNLLFLKHGDWRLSCEICRTRICVVCKEISAGEKKRRKKGKTKVTLLSHAVFQPASLDWGRFEGQISWQGNFVRTTCSAADYPWDSIVFVYQKMLIACFYE